MTVLGSLLRAKLRAAAHSAAAIRRESRLKVAFVSISVCLLWVGLFAVAWGTLRWLDGLGAELLGKGAVTLAELLLPRLLSLFAGVLFVMLAFSSVLLALATLYRTPEMAFLLTTPLSGRELFLARFAEIVTLGSWSTAYLGSPVLLAWGLSSGAPPQLYLAAALLFVPFVVIPAALGTSLAMLLARVLPSLPRAVATTCGLLVLGGAFTFFRARLAEPTVWDVPDLGFLISLAAQAQSSFLPGSWLTSGLLGAQRGATSDTLFHLLLLLANAAFFTWLAAELAERILLPGWSGLAGGRRAITAPRLAWLERALLPVRGPARLLALKDIKTFARDPAQWSQFAIFFGVLALYVASMRTGGDATSVAFWQGWRTLLNTLASLLVLASLTTRFVFPLISLEGRRFWLLSLAPITRRELIRQKLLLAVTASAIVTVGLAVMSSWRLGLSPLPFLTATLTAAGASFALSGLAVGLGSLYPSFAEENPARIVSGMGGTLTFIVSLAYVVVVAAAQTVVLQWHHLGRRLGGSHAYPWAVAAALTFIVAVSALTTWLPLRAGARHLERVEP